MSEPKIAAVILAAGFSRRLGRPKQTLVLNGETLVERAVRVALEARFDPVIAVLAEDSMIPALKAMGATALLNREAFEGMSTSIHAGVKWARGVHADGVVLMTCDQIAVCPEHLLALSAERDTPTGSAYAGRIGIPAYFPASSFEALLRLEGDTGARDLLRDARSVATEDLAFDIDTEEDVVLAKALLVGR